MSDFWMGMGGTVPLSVFYLNTIITPDNPVYKISYFEDK